MQETMARESYAWGELAELMADPIFWSPPRAKQRRAVLVLPGLFGNDLYLQPLLSWLSRSGHQAIGSSLLINAGCPERLSRRVERHLESRLRAQSDPVAIIGHSRGGLLARTVAARLGERASHLILLASPVGGITQWAAATGMPHTRASERVQEASTQARRLLDPDCAVPECGCPFPEDFLRPLDPATQVVSIYAPDDPIVPARACPVAGARNIEVRGTHTGLAFNRTVYRELAKILA